MPRALRINPADNVAVVLEDVAAGERIEVMGEGFEVTALGSIPRWHKVALEHIAKDQPVIKYGEEIGRASTEIEAGSFVHTHNVYCTRGYR